MKSLRKFLELEEDPKVIFTDHSLEFVFACEDLFWNHCTSRPHWSETNGIAEKAVRRVKEVTSSVLVQSGLDDQRCADAMECYCQLRNVQDVCVSGDAITLVLCEPLRRARAHGAYCTAAGASISSVTWFTLECANHCQPAACASHVRDRPINMAMTHNQLGRSRGPIRRDSRQM